MAYSEHPIAIKLLLGTFILAIYSMWVMSERNGYMESLRHLQGHGPHLLPGSTTPLLKSYTGMARLDHFLTVLQCVFANVTDGSAPHLSLLAFYFLGQLTAMISGMVVESQRSFNIGKTSSWFILWGIAIQGFGFGVVMPIYAIVHLSTTARFASTSKHALGAGLKTIPQAIILGYILPTILAALPVSPVLHQQLVAAWQLFPGYVSSIMFINKKFVNPPTTSEIRSQLTRIYHFSGFVALWTHRLTIATLLLIKIKPDSFPPTLIESLSFSNVFLPPFPSVSVKVSMIDGALAFFQYDMLTGFLAAIIWQFSISDIYLHVDLVLDVLMKGPGYTFVRITEIRDNILFEVVQAEEEKTIRQGFSDLGMDENFVNATKEIRDQGEIDRKGKLNSY